jgi:hypothetical protein
MRVWAVFMLTTLLLEVKAGKACGKNADCLREELLCKGKLLNSSACLDLIA